MVALHYVVLYGIAGWTMMMPWVIFYAMLVTGAVVLAAALWFLMAMPLVWWHPLFLRGFALRNAPWMMLVRFRIIKVPLWCAWWFLKEEIKYLHDRFREAHQTGDMCVDFENLYNEQYLTDGQYPVGTSVLPSPGPAMEIDAPMEEQNAPMVNPNEMFEEGADLEEIALRHVMFNGSHLDQTVYEGQVDEQHQREADAEMAEEDDVAETPRARNRRYMEAEQGQVSDPEHWATLHYGHMEWDDYERMRAFGRANRLRLERAVEPLLQRREAAQIAGNWEEASQYTCAIAEIELLQDIA